MVGILKILGKVVVPVWGLIFAAQLYIPPAAAGDSLSDPTEPELGEKKSREPTNNSPPDKPSWELTCIIHSPRRELAVINGKILQKGDSVSGGKVVNINADGVVLYSRGKRHLLRVEETIMQKNIIDKYLGGNSE